MHCAALFYILFVLVWCFYICLVRLIIYKIIIFFTSCWGRKGKEREHLLKHGCGGWILQHLQKNSLHIEDLYCKLSRFNVWYIFFYYMFENFYWSIIPVCSHILSLPNIYLNNRIRYTFIFNLYLFLCNIINDLSF